MSSTMTTRRRLLLIDDDTRLLKSVSRMSQIDRADDWEISYCADPEEALEWISCSFFDVIVCDMRMPRRSGKAVLQKAMESSPSSIRVILSGQAEDSTVLEAASYAHRYFAKPCDFRKLLDDCREIRVKRDSLTHQGVREAVLGLSHLPILTAVVERVIESLESTTISDSEIVFHFEHNVALGMKVLQVANYPYYAPDCPVDSIEMAVRLLGRQRLIELLRSIRVEGCTEDPQAAVQCLGFHQKFSSTVGALYQLAQHYHIDAPLRARAVTVLQGRILGQMIIRCGFPVLHAVVRRYQGEAGKSEVESLISAEYRSLMERANDLLLALWGLPLPTISMGVVDSVSQDESAVLALLVSKLFAEEGTPTFHKGSEVVDYLKRVESALPLMRTLETTQGVGHASR